MSEPSAPPLGETELMRFVAECGLEAERVVPGVPTPTVAAAAAAVGAEPSAIVKSLLFLAEGEPTLVVAAGEGRVDLRALAAALGVSRRKLRFADADRALAIAGYPIGGMPPIGHRRPLPTLIDRDSVPTSGTLWAGGGSRRALLRVDAAALLAAIGGTPVPLGGRTAPQAHEGETR